MTMPKFEPVARLIPVSLPDYDKVWARTFDEYPQELSSSNPFVNGEESPLYTADQLTEAYEAGKREAKIDAGRYRWLRNALSDRSENGVSYHFCSIRTSEELDDSIDAAIAATPKGEVK